MRKFGTTLAVVAISTGVLSGCATPPGGAQSPQQKAAGSCKVFGTKTTTGALFGAALGAVAGGLLGGGKGALEGAGAGALLGGGIGKALDVRDCREATAAMAQMGTAATGTQLAWANPDNGHRGSFTPVTDIRIQSGRQCRDYTEELIVDGKTTSEKGITCRTEQGDWERMS